VAASARVGDPGAIVPGARLALLVGAPRHRAHSPAGRRDRYLRRHAAHRMRTAAMTGPDQKLDVGFQERPVHGQRAAVGQHELRAVPEFLDEAEDVVPAAAVQAGDVLAQLVQDFVHLEGGEQGLDQHRCLDRARACRAPAGPQRTHRSTGAPRGGPRASAGKSMARCLRGPAPRGCWPGTARNRTARRIPPGRRCARAFPADASRADARSAWRCAR
jgi:hypothetical protein